MRCDLEGVTGRREEGGRSRLEVAGKEGGCYTLVCCFKPTLSYVSDSLTLYHIALQTKHRFASRYLGKLLNSS